MKRFDAVCLIKEIETGTKKFKPVTDASGAVVDYRDVTIEGYLSTFKHVTESDRDGDYVEPGAFRDTIKKFLSKNPVMLVDHRNSVSTIAGRFVEMKEDKDGLFIVAKVSDSPDMINVRFKAVEGSLRAMSMGGLFHFKEDGRGIFKVDLFEGSLVAIPANQDALISTRSLNETEEKYVKSGQRLSFPDFVAEQQISGDQRGSKTGAGVAAH